MVVKSMPSLNRNQPRVRLLKNAGEDDLIACGVDLQSLPIMLPKMRHYLVKVEGVRVYAANILKQCMLSLGGDAAVHRNVITGKIEFSDCILMGDERHFAELVEKLQSQPGLGQLADSIRYSVFRKKSGLTLKLCGQHFNWQHRPVVMGILNVTPDSFSDGGFWDDPQKALEHARDLVSQGAEILDIGGESTRPGSRAVDAGEEIERVIPIIEKIAGEIDIPISIDTQKAEVAHRAVDAGAKIINDVSAMDGDPDMLATVKKTGAGIILMHMRGRPENMQDNTAYDNIMDNVYNYLDEKVALCLQEGISPESIIVDPGIGFGKALDGNLSLIRRIAEFKSIGVPVLLGHSRKSFLGTLLETEVDNREEGTDAVTAWATLEGVDMVRVHDASRARHVRTVLQAIRGEL